MDEMITQAIDLAAAAYWSEHKLRNKLEDVGYTCVRSIVNEQTDTQAFACVWKDTLWISVRGTEPHNWDDWRTNLSTGFAANPWGLAHMGFYHDAQSIWDEVWEIVETNLILGRQIRFTGHSQGGAVAEQLFSILYHRYTSKTAKCISIEAPRSFSKEAAMALGVYAGGQMIQVKNNNDLVPDTPLECTGYKHVYNCHIRYINRNGKILKSVPWWVRTWDRTLGFLQNPVKDWWEDHLIQNVSDAWRKHL